MIQPRISIVTPSFNQGRYIEQTILSILEQDYENIELIIIDGGSTDNTVEIIKKYENRIAYWVSEKDDGQANAINKGLAKATGVIFNWINSDDYLEPGALKAIAAAFAKDTSKKIICGYTHCFYNETGATSHTYRMGIQKTVAATILNVEMNQPGSFYSMDIIRSIGGVNESLRYVFDGELWFRFLCKCGLHVVGYCNELIAHFRLHQSSKSVGAGYYEFYKEFLNIHLFISKSSRTPLPVIGYLEKDQLIEKYSSNPWEMDFFETEKWQSLMTDKYKFLLYKDRFYKLARQGVKHHLLHLNGRVNKGLAALTLKLALPIKIIEMLRTQKHKVND